MRTGVAIIGSGFGGLGTAIRLKQDGLSDFVILERAGDVGGTWRDNSYPGCACDVASHFYSLSFAPNPDWSDRYSRQPEIWRYLQRLADDYQLRPHLRFQAEVRGARWDEAEGLWHLETAAGPVSASVVVLASGPLSEPVIPEIRGLGGFEGPMFHSARWDHGFDLTGRRVAVIGTGASAAQFIPEIQPRVARLTVFQRTPPWVMPRADARIRPWQRRLYRRVPILQRLLRFGIYVRREAALLLFRHPWAMRQAQLVARFHLRRSVRDPVLRARLTPSYTMGCKRIVLSNDYYPALTRPNVEVVTAGIAEVRARSIVADDGLEREIDAIILGTGFRPTDPPLAPLIRGRGGRTLAEAWAGSPKAHAGTAVSGFPNLFLLLGPNTGVGHTSAVYMMEAQIEHVLGALRFMRAAGARAVDPRRDVQEAYVSSIDRLSKGTVWTAGGCRSWYLDRTGRNSAVWPDFTWKYRWRTARFRPGDYVADQR
jgi:cation diffusion facilitator CzcD-associated flavoprotein CzcO